MNDIELIDVITSSIKSAVSDAFLELGISNRVAGNAQTAYKKTEQLLWNYTKIKQLIIDKEEQIQEVLDAGLRTKAKDITEYGCAGGEVRGIVTREEAVQEVVDAIQYDVLWIRQCLERLELALDKVRKDPDYPILESYYFKGATGEELALEYETSIPTVMKRKNALVRDVALYLFPKDAISEMLE